MIQEDLGDGIPLLHLVPLMLRLSQISDAHKKYGLTKSQIFVLTALSYRKQLTMGEIAEYMASSKEQATRAVAGLCDQKLVERFELPENRTHVYIRFSEDGLQFMKDFCKEVHLEIDERLEASLTEEELQLLQESVQTTIQLLRKVK